jgi:dTDP-4-amino-4,6-dideoxygalactose transaminase
MTEICAAMGLTSLEAMDDIIAINKRNYEAYRRALSGLPGITVITHDSAERRNYQYVVAEVAPGSSPLTRDDLIAALHAEHVLARRYFWPGCHRMEPYKSLQPNASLLLPETERIASRIMVLPTGQAMAVETVEAVCDIIRSALDHAPEVQRVMAQRAHA